MAGSGVRGNFSGLKVLIERVSAERIAQVKQSLIVNLAQEARTQIALGFEQGKAPDGTPWKPLARKRPRDKRGSKGIPLNDTGRLKNSWTYETRPNGFAWVSNVSYAPPHQFGATIHQKARTNIHAKSGKFISRVAAGRKKRANRVSFSPEGSYGLPARPMVPIGDLPPPWKNAFERAAKSTLMGYGMGG